MYRLTGMHPWKNVRVPSLGWYATTTFDKVGDTLWAKLDPDQRGLLKGLRCRWNVVWHNKQRNIPHELQVHLPGGGMSRCIFKAFEQGRESFQATDLDWAHFDEQFDQSILTETITRIGPDRSMDFAAAFTPLNPQPWLEHRTVVEQRPGDDVFYFPLDDNRISSGGFIPDELIDATIENWPPEARDTRRQGRWGTYQGAIFQTFSRDLHVVTEEKEQRIFLRDGRLPEPQVLGSIDWGGNNPFCFLWVARIPHMDNDFYVFDEYYWSFVERGPRRLEEHADEIKARTAKWGAALNRTWADHDPTDANEFANYGIPSFPSDKKDRRAGIETLQVLLAPRLHLRNEDFPQGRPRIHIAARCTNLLRELPAYRWKEGTERQDAPREPMKINDHSVDCVRYLVHSEASMDLAPSLAIDSGVEGMFSNRF